MNIFKRYKKWEREVYKKKAWNIGFLNFDETTIFKPFKISWLDLNGYDKGWFADPFILSAKGDRIEVLVEEMMLDKPPAKIFQVGRQREVTRQWGRISKLEIRLMTENRFRLEKVVPVIEDKYHYSFPAIYRDSDKDFHPSRKRRIRKIAAFPLRRKKLSGDFRGNALRCAACRRDSL